MSVSVVNVADKELLESVADAVKLDLGMNDTQLGAVRSAVFFAALLVFNIYRLVPLMAAAFILGVVTFMVIPAVTLILFSVVPPETKSTMISASSVMLNLVIRCCR